MTLSVQDRVALIYTSQGSQRKVAAALGISHQKVGRLLRIGEDGGYKQTSRILTNPELLASIKFAFANHVALVKRTAKAQGLPFDSSAPVFAARMPQMDGKLGDRVDASHVHWLSNAMRDAWLTAMHKSGKYYAASIGSIVNLKLYNKQADERKRETRSRRTPEQQQNKRQIVNLLDNGIDRGLIQTRYTPMIQEFDIDSILDDINDKMRHKHEPATGERGTVLAARVLLQLDTRSKAKPQNAKHSTKPRKTAGSKRRAK